jgi:hypothetical protein
MYGNSYLPGVPPGIPPVLGIPTSIPALSGILQNIPPLPGIPQDTPTFPGIPQNHFPISSYYGGPSGSNDESQVPDLQQQMAGLAMTETPGKLIAALKKLYTNNQKFKAKRYKMLNYKLRTFYKACTVVGILQANYHIIYSNMLANNAFNFYNSYLAYKNLIFAQIIEKTRTYFHTPENYQMHINE